MNNLKLSIAMGDYDRTRPIVDGRVKINGVDPTCMLLSPDEMFFRAFRHNEFDISELSISSYCVSVAKGNPHYVAIPVFLSRAFRHTSIYIRTDRGIEKPQDLKGKRIGIAEYQLSANVWVRGFLEDGYGVKPSDIIWIRGGMDTPERPEKIQLDLPADIRIEEAEADATLNQMLADGDIDGFIGPRWPRCFHQGHPHVRRLFSDSVSAAESHYKQTGIFPIMHVLGVRRTLATENPWLPSALLKGFSQAKAIAQEALNDTSATKVTMPFVEDNLDRVRHLIGPDYWSYGIQNNAKVLDAFFDMHFRQGLSPRRLSLEETFHPTTMEVFSV